MSHRALLTVLALTVADLLLWHWSLAGNRDVLAIISGLTLPPLCVALLWLTAVNLARLLARGVRRPAARLRAQTTRVMRRRAAAGEHIAALSAVPARLRRGGTPAASSESSRKLAA